MNERIKELYRLCRPKEALASQDQFQSSNVLLGTEVEKFAELIIRECAGIAADAEQSKGGMPAKYHVLDHFGVEE